MPSFSRTSKDRLVTCHHDLQRLFVEVVKHWDCTVLEGKRTKEQQRKNVRDGVSKTMDSRHLDDPANAVDVAPYPVDWEDMDRFYAFGGFVLGVASQMSMDIRWGGDWDVDRDLSDQTFDDLPHFELR